MPEEWSRQSKTLRVRHVVMTKLFKCNTQGGAFGKEFTFPHLKACGTNMI